MAGFKTFFKSGHPATLFAAFLYFDFCFAMWDLHGAMAPFMSESFHLSASEKGFLVSLPILAGAFLRFPLGILSQYIGRKNAALVEMGLVFIGLLYGFFFVKTLSDVHIMSIILGIAGASFGIAMALGAGWFPPEQKGLAMGVVGAGNSGSILVLLFAPPLAMRIGWQNVYGVAAAMMFIPWLVMLIIAKEPPDTTHQSFKDHVKCLWEKDGWIFNLSYMITFGGFIGLANYLPTYFHDNFGVTKVQAAQLTILAALMGASLRAVGGYMSDRWGGISTLRGIFIGIIALMLIQSIGFSLLGTTILFMLCFACFGIGNGATFQLVPLRWPTTTAVAGSMIGEIGAIGGAFLPNAVGLSKRFAGTPSYGFISFALFAFVILIALSVAQHRWTKSWVGKGGKALRTDEVKEYYAK